MMDELIFVFDLIMPDGVVPLATMLLWVVNFTCVTCNLFISLYLFIVHDDLANNQIQPLELSGHIKQVMSFQSVSSFI